MSARRICLPAAVMLAMGLLAGCGYHLVGAEDGGGFPMLAGGPVQVTGNDAAMTAALRDALAASGVSLAGEGAAARQRLTLRLDAPVMTPSAYDAAGAPVQYRLAVGGELRLEAHSGATGEGAAGEDWREVWRSGRIEESGQVYATGGPASIEASRERLMRDLRAAWLARALSALRSGF